MKNELEDHDVVQYVSKNQKCIPHPKPTTRRELGRPVPAPSTPQLLVKSQTSSWSQFEAPLTQQDEALAVVACDASHDDARERRAAGVIIIPGLADSKRLDNTRLADG